MRHTAAKDLRDRARLCVGRPGKLTVEYTLPRIQVLPKIKARARIRYVGERCLNYGLGLLRVPCDLSANPANRNGDSL